MLDLTVNLITRIELYDLKTETKNREVIADRKYGGLEILDIEAREEATQVMWLKRWLAPKDKRPIWVAMTDEIIKANITAKPIIREENKLKWISQS